MPWLQPHVNNPFVRITSNLPEPLTNDAVPTTRHPDDPTVARFTRHHVLPTQPTAASRALPPTPAAIVHRTTAHRTQSLPTECTSPRHIARKYAFLASMGPVVGLGAVLVTPLPMCDRV